MEIIHIYLSRGVVTIRIHKSKMYTRISKYPDIQIRRYSNTRLFRYTDTQISGYTEYTDIRISGLP
jgi:hypothetical protein